MLNNARGPSYMVRGQRWAFIPWHIVKTKNTHSLALPDSLVAEMPFPISNFLRTRMAWCIRRQTECVCRFEYINCVCVNAYNEIRRQQRPILIRGNEKKNNNHARKAMCAANGRRHTEGTLTTEWEIVCVECAAEATVNDKKKLELLQSKVHLLLRTSGLSLPSFLSHPHPPPSSPLRHRNDNDAEWAWVREWQKIGISRCATLHTVCTPCTISWKTALEWWQWLMTTEMVLANLGVGRNHFINIFFFFFVHLITRSSDESVYLVCLRPTRDDVKRAEFKGWWNELKCRERPRAHRQKHRTADRIKLKAELNPLTHTMPRWVCVCLCVGVDSYGQVALVKPVADSTHACMHVFIHLRVRPGTKKISDKKI